MEKIVEHIKIHDKFQFEIKFDYALSKHKKNTDYTVDSYFFLPNSLGINRHSYPSELFYRDIQTYIRFLTAPISLEQLANGAGFIEAIRKKIEKIKLERSDDHETNLRLIHHIRMLCNVFRSSAKEHISFLEGKNDLEDLEHIAERYLECTQEVIQKYRGLRPLFIDPSIPENLLNTFLYGDEYLSILFEKFAFTQLDLLKGKCPILFKDLKPRFISAIKLEFEYRNQKKYHACKGKDPSHQEMVYRHGVLKRYFESNLFIDTRLKQEGRLMLQIVYSLAAGLAMIFATVVAFFAQQKYGTFTLPLFVALVLSYIFKDRMKELSRSWIYSRWAKKAFDQKTSFFLGNNQLGFSKEHFGFLPEDQVDPQALNLRNNSRMTTLEHELAHERIFLYRKKVRIFSKNIRDEFQDTALAGVTDLMRFNVNKIIRKMDDPKKSLFVLDGDSYKKVEGRKVYHLNLVIRYSSSTDVVYKRSRIIFNRSGIREILEVT